MAWSKIKTIIILILLLLNLFLLALVGVIQMRSAQYEAAALSEAAAVLELNSIQVAASSLPSSMTLSAAAVSRDYQQETVMAAAILGEELETRSTGGGLRLYESAFGSISFRSGGEFSMSFTDPPAPPEGGSRLDQVQALLDRMGLSVWRLSETGDTVTAVQSLDGAPVFSAGIAGAGLAFAYDGEGRLISVTGRLALGRAAAEPGGQEPLTVPTILISFFNFIMDSGDACHCVYEVTAIYRAAFLSDPVRLTPAWLITTDIGDYYVDAYSAEVTRISNTSARAAGR